MSTREEFLENEIRTLNHHMQSMIDTMKVMSMNKQNMSDEIKRLWLEVETAVKAEREACALLCDKISDEDGFEGGYAGYCADMIRARGQG